MNKILTILCLLTPLLSAAPISPERVVVLYNSAIAESKELAEYYAKAREIPQANLIGLKLPNKDEISRADYDTSLRDPLRQALITQGFWKMGKNAQGFSLPIRSKVSTLVCMRGVPFKIKRSPVTQTSTQQLPAHFAKATEASVDSELALSGVYGILTVGPLNNPYFKKNQSISKAEIAHMMLVGRIDGPSYPICKQMIDDAIATEQQGLWGMCYLDKALKGSRYKTGDQWLDHIARRNDAAGIPTVVDANKQTFTTNYPMHDAALYFGWYTKHKNGPLLNPAFKFRRGAVAVHLHSFSASKLRDSKKNWTGAILAHGATATLGNVYEPYLQLTHHLDIFHDSLLKGHTLVEAAYMAIPYLSWQNVVLGDPLYRPFLHLNGTGTVAYDDKDFRAIRVANQRWGNEPETMVKKLRTTAADKGNARFYEYLGLWYRARKQHEIATAFFQTASKKHLKEADRLRQWLYQADIQRSSGEKKLAVATLKEARSMFGEIPEVKSVVGLLNILDPPAPPPAKKNGGKAK